MDLIDTNPFDLAAEMIGPRPQRYDERETLKLGDRRLSPGLYLMASGTGKGKTVSAMALAVQIFHENDLKDQVYWTVLEPRTPTVNLQLSKKLQDPGTAREGMNDIMKGRRIAIVDSLTHVVAGLGVGQLGKTSDSTFKGGIQRSWILGVLALEMEAREKRCCLIATVNSDLLPGSEAMEGACEGAITIPRIGALMIRDRSDRSRRELALDPRAVRSASKLLGYDSSNPSTPGAFIA